MDKKAVNIAAEALLAARRDRTPLQMLPDGARPRNIKEGYRIQAQLCELGGETPFGWKVGATSDTAQRHLRVGEPFCGRLFEETSQQSPAKVEASAFTSFRLIEPEFAFRLRATLAPRAAAYGRNEILSAIEAVYPAVEIVDSRYLDWLMVGTPSLVADNGVHGAFVYGAPIAKWQRIDLRSLRVALTRNGKQVASGFGMAALGDPVNVVLWLANHLSKREITLEAGSFVTTGVVTDLSHASAGDELLADFGPVGKVQVTFTD